VEVGKYPNSSIHAKYSDFHIKEIAPYCSMTDIDRIWVECRKNKIVAFIDLKYFGEDTITETEKIVYRELKKIAPVYFVYLNYGFDKFIVYEYGTKNKNEFSKEQYINWVQELGGKIETEPSWDYILSDIN